MRPPNRPPIRQRPSSAPAENPASGWNGTDFAASLALALLAVAVYHGALRYFFSQDDFAGLARAAGLLERLSGPWRLISHQFFFDLMRAIAGLNALPYHAVSLASHAACGILLYAWLVRWCSKPAAFAGAAFFLCHAALFTAIYWISAIGDIHALLFALVSLRLALGAGTWRWAALPLFVLSLLSKESTLLLPAIVGTGLMVGARPGTPRGFTALRDPVHLGLWAIAVAWAWFLTLGNRSGTPAEHSTLAPYAVALGANLWQNLLTYLGWSANFLLVLTRGVSDRTDSTVYGYGVALAVLLVLGTASAALKARGWMIAGAAVMAFLIPVLPLLNHTYHYYLYAAMAPIAWLVAAAIDWLLSGRRWRSATQWAIAGALSALFAINGAAFVRKNETTPFIYLLSRGDPTIDRALIATRATVSVREAGLPPGSRLYCYSAARLTAAQGDAREAYWERNVRTALLDGLALDVLFPSLGEVKFVRERQAAREGDYYGVYDTAGRLRIVTPAGLDTLERDVAGQ